MTLAYAILLISVLIASSAQILMKISALRKVGQKSHAKSFLLGGYVLMVISLLLNILAFKHIDLSDAAFIIALSYVFVPILSVLILKERYSLKFWIGITFISVGVLYSSLTG